MSVVFAHMRRTRVSVDVGLISSAVRAVVIEIAVLVVIAVVIIARIVQLAEGRAGRWINGAVPGRAGARTIEVFARILWRGRVAVRTESRASIVKFAMLVRAAI